MPPKGNLGSDFTISFTKAQPACNCVLAIFSPLIKFFVKIAAPNPKIVSFAISTASFSFFAVINMLLTF